ncbi:hypothetical protein LTR93_011547 [Exophiala xenobiotica]|nr:hypothetical protein LTR93_011547 [Exophiala xenobiotica]
MRPLQEPLPRQQMHLQIPTASNDRLAMQPTYSVENIHNSQGHNQEDEQQFPPGGDMGYERDEYIVSPEDHHDAYYTRPYCPHPPGDYALDPYSTPVAGVPHVRPPERDEFTHMRYSAATRDLANFYNERFTFRQRLFAKPRQTELFIVVTMYNEDEFLFARTMMGVFKNIEFMCNRNSSKT